MGRFFSLTVVNRRINSGAERYDAKNPTDEMKPSNLVAGHKAVSAPHKRVTQKFVEKI
jgi:hypothetical protein